jgi:hypothetical protein
MSQPGLSDQGTAHARRTGISRRPTLDPLLANFFAAVTGVDDIVERNMRVWTSLHRPD